MLEQDLTRWQDPCLVQGFSVLRFAVFALLFVAMLGTAPLLIWLNDRPYGIQLSSMVGYTAAVAFYTFSRNRNGNQPFLLSCPVVRGQLARLIRRHLGLLAALFTAQTAALKLRPNLAAQWAASGRGNVSLFAPVLGVLCGCLAIAQILTNRSLLDRAHASAQTGDSFPVGEKLPLHG